ncbi:MAG: hypothetical protein KME12_27245 [Trichocoleus desertorum ATA4-8-CV12]|jgi:hypothetical protein|nr:hypothetical protein [Trichocoleus desertorum ATA4-8-CV12]
MIDFQTLTRWLTMIYEIDGQLRQLAQVSNHKDQEPLEEAVAQIRYAKIALLKAKGLTDLAWQKPYLRAIQEDKFNEGAPF